MMKRWLIKIGLIGSFLWTTAVWALNDQTTSGDCSPIIGEVGGDVKIICGIPLEKYEAVLGDKEKLAVELGVTKNIVLSFFATLGMENVPPEKWTVKFFEIAKSRKELESRVAMLEGSEDPEVERLIAEAKVALEKPDSAEVERLLNEVSDRDVAAAKRLQEIAEKRLLSAAEAKYANGELKMTQLAYLEAAKYFQQAAELLPEKYEDQLGLYLNQAGVAFHKAGQYAQALPLLQRSLAIFEKVFGKEHLTVEKSLNNLAALYQDQGEYAQALPLYQRSLAISEQVSSPVEVAMSLNNLALLYQTQGEYAQALPLYERSLAINEKVFGKEHPNVALNLNNLAVLYNKQGEYEKALPLQERSLAIREKVFGKEHPDVAQSLNNLAVLYDAQGKYEKALPLFQRSLAIWEKVLGQEHPDVAISLNNLAELYGTQGEYDQALPLYERSLAIDEKVYGKDHFEVAKGFNNLALLYYAQGEYEKALPLLKRSVAILEKKLGKDHPKTKAAIENLHRVQQRLNGEQFQVLVNSILPDGQAAQLGIQVGDIFTHYDNQPILGTSHFINGRKKEPADGPAKELKVLRDGKELIFKIKPGKIGVELEEKVK